MKTLALLATLCLAGCNCNLGTTFNPVNVNTDTTVNANCQMTEMPTFNFFGTTVNGNGNGKNN